MVSCPVVYVGALAGVGAAGAMRLGPAGLHVCGSGPARQFLTRVLGAARQAQPASIPALCRQPLGHTGVRMHNMLDAIYRVPAELGLSGFLVFYKWDSAIADVSARVTPDAHALVYLHWPWPWHGSYRWAGFRNRMVPLMPDIPPPKKPNAPPRIFRIVGNVGVVGICMLQAAAGIAHKGHANPGHARA